MEDTRGRTRFLLSLWQEFSGGDGECSVSKFFVLLTAQVNPNPFGTGGVTPDVLPHRPDKGRQVAGQIGVAATGDGGYAPQRAAIASLPGERFEVQVT